MSATTPLASLDTPLGSRSGLHRPLVNLDRPLPWLLPATLLLAVFGLYPLGYSIWLSLHKWNRIQRELEFVGLDQWRTLLADERMWHAFGVTCLYSMVCLALQVVLGLALALLLDSDRKGFGVVRALISLPMVVPPAVTGLMFLLMLDGQFGVLSYYGVALGLLQQGVPLLAESHTAIFGLLLADVWQWTPFMVLLFIAGLRAIPKEPYEAAAVDGANALQQFVHITLPMLGRVFAIAVLIRGIDLFRIYDYVYVMTGGGPGVSTETLSYYAGRVFTLGNFPYAAALSLLVLVLVTVLASLVIRIFRVRF